MKYTINSQYFGEIEIFVYPLENTFYTIVAYDNMKNVIEKMHFTYNPMLEEIKTIFNL